MAPVFFLFSDNINDIGSPAPVYHNLDLGGLLKIAGDLMSIVYWNKLRGIIQ